ncbi:carbonic anhydrase, partial [Streptomyces sp. NPDC059956]
MSSNTQASSASSPSRRVLLRTALAGTAAAGSVGSVLGLGSVFPASAAEASAEALDGARPRSPEEALRRLAAGNRRWAAYRQQHPHESRSVRLQVAREQHPFAIVLG